MEEKKYKGCIISEIKKDDWGYNIGFRYKAIGLGEPIYGQTLKSIKRIIDDTKHYHEEFYRISKL